MSWATVMSVRRSRRCGFAGATSQRLFEAGLGSLVLVEVVLLYSYQGKSDGKASGTHDGKRILLRCGCCVDTIVVVCPSNRSIVLAIAAAATSNSAFSRCSPVFFSSTAQVRVTFPSMSHFPPCFAPMNNKKKKEKRQEAKAKLWGISPSKAVSLSTPKCASSKHTTTLRSSRFYPDGCAKKIRDGVKVGRVVNLMVPCREKVEK